MANANILVVEDEQLVAQGIQESLLHLGYSVAGPASSGEEAITMVKESEPDVILMDICLTGKMDGVETAQRLGAVADIPIIYLTASADPQTLARAKLTEPCGYILKPYGKHELQAAIEIALYKNRAEKQRRRLTDLLQSICKINKIIFREKERGRLLGQACQILTQTRGYTRAWIALVDDGGRVTASATAGRAMGVAVLGELLQSGDLPDCGRRCLREESGIMIITDMEVSCPDCICQADGKHRSALLLKLAHEKTFYGLLGICLKTSLAADDKEISLLQELAEDIALALANLEMAEQARKSEAALRASEAKYRLVFDNAPLGLMHYDQDGVIIAVNDIFVAIIGSSRQKLLGFRMLHQLRDEKMRQAVNVSLEGRTGYYEGEYFSVTGVKKTQVRVFFQSIFSETGDFLGGICIAEDYTEKFRAEQEKQKALNFLQTLMDAIPNPVFYKDVNGRYLGINKACETLWGRTRSEVIGNRFSICTPMTWRKSITAEIWPYFKTRGHRFMKP